MCEKIRQVQVQHPKMKRAREEEKEGIIVKRLYGISYFYAYRPRKLDENIF